MAIVIKPITVEVSKPNVFQAIAAKQNDSNSRFLKVTFANEGEKIFVTPSANVTINAERNDGESNSFFGAVNDDGTVTVPIHSWILELPGYVNCDVSIIEEDSKLTCTTFSLLVEEASHGSNDISNDEQGDVLVALINDVKEMQSGGVFGNAIQNTVTGSIVSLTDISPLKHTLTITARSQNQFKPLIINSWNCNVVIGENDLITLTSTHDSGVAYAKVGRVTFKKGKTYICKAIEAYNVGSLLFWLPNTTTTIWNTTTPTYTPTEDITADLAVYMGEIGDGYYSSFYIQLEEGTTAPTKHTTFIPIGSVRKEYTIEADAKEYISIVDIDKCIAKSKAEGRTYANGIESFEVIFYSGEGGYYRIDDWYGSEAELLNQWGISMLQPPEADLDSYLFDIFYKDGTNIKAVVAGKNFAQVNSVVAPYDKAVTIFEGEISGDFVLSCKNNVTEFTNPTASLFSWTFKDGTVVYSQRADSFKSVNISGVLTKVELYTYSYPKVGSIDNIQLELGTNQTEYEPYKEPTTHSITADGTVEGVTSIYPTTVITSGTEGVVFDVGYNADTKKYIDNKFAELAALIVNS